MSIQALRERKTAIAQAANQLLAEKGDQVWTKDDQTKYDEMMDKLGLVANQITAHQRLLDETADKIVRDTERAGGKGAEMDAAAVAKALFAKVLRTSPKDLTPEDVAQIRNTMSTTTGSEGGFTVPTTIVPMLSEALKAFGGMRDVAEIIKTESGNAMNYPATDGTGEEGEIVGENQPVSGQDITFTGAALNVYKYSSKKVAVPWELIQDSAIDIVQLVLNRLAQRLGRITNRHYTTGTGNGQPFGIVTRASAGKVGATGSTVLITYDDLVTLVHSVNSAYRRSKGVGFMMADSSVGVLRKMKDGNGRPIFTPGYEYGITQDVPDLLLGKPIRINDDVPVMAANAKSMLFGDLSQYKIRDVTGVDVKRFDDSYFALNGQVGFCGWQRTGGNLVDTAAVKYYQNSAT